LLAPLNSNLMPETTTQLEYELLELIKDIQQEVDSSLSKWIDERLKNMVETS